MDTITRKKAIQTEVQYTTRWEVAKEILASVAFMILMVGGAWLLLTMGF